jgi:hypothetical protein
VNEKRKVREQVIESFIWSRKCSLVNISNQVKIMENTEDLAKGSIQQFSRSFRVFVASKIH